MQHRLDTNLFTRPAPISIQHRLRLDGCRSHPRDPSDRGDMMQPANRRRDLDDMAAAPLKSKQVL